MEDCILTTTLDYPGQAPVTTDDAERVDTLIRKGWTVRPDMPAFDPATQQCTWDGGQWVISNLPPPMRHITKLAFRNRFTQAEKVTIEMAQLDNPAATMQARAQAAALRASQQDIVCATYIDLGRADTRAGVQQLESAGLLAAGRAAQILDAPIGDTEVYRG